ncbi:hypothetical protein PR048_014549 [Dryococelus australis]|uniref:Uncharacterized protein n=1 Tax=Dryococelus australis TaxID=614101 RepID=A0ABQ9HEI3_9NEOP|nr:hypothetical protein PR048_014549 [Dryococelus australis]
MFPGTANHHNHTAFSTAITQSQSAVHWWAWLLGLGTRPRPSERVLDSGAHLTVALQGAHLHIFAFGAQKLRSSKVYTAALIKCSIATTRKVLNWRAISSLRCVYLWDFKSNNAVILLGEITAPLLRGQKQKWVAERLACSPPTKAIRVQSPAGSLRIFACGNRAGRCRWSTGFLGDLPFPPPFHSGDAPYSPQSPLSALKTSTFQPVSSSDNNIRPRNSMQMAEWAVAGESSGRCSSFWGGGDALATSAHQFLPSTFPLQRVVTALPPAPISSTRASRCPLPPPLERVIRRVYLWTWADGKGGGGRLRGGVKDVVMFYDDDQNTRGGDGGREQPFDTCAQNNRSADPRYWHDKATDALRVATFLSLRSPRAAYMAFFYFTRPVVGNSPSPTTLHSAHAKPAPAVHLRKHARGTQN